MAGIFSSLGRAAAGPPPGYSAVAPGKKLLRHYKRREKADIEGLYKDRPYQDPSLGYAPEVEAKAKALSEGDVTAERQDLYDAYARGGPYGTRSREYLSAEAGRLRSARERGQREAAGIAVRSADVARSDYGRRHGMLSRAYHTGMGERAGYDQMKFGAAQAKHAAKADKYATYGSIVDMATIGAI